MPKDKTASSERQESKEAKRITQGERKFLKIRKRETHKGDWSTLKEETEANLKEQSYKKGKGQIRRMKETNIHRENVTDIKTW